MSTVRDYLTTMEKALDMAEGTETDYEVVGGIEEKVRRIRTAAGARRFGAPIGSIIRADGSIETPDGKVERGTAPKTPDASKPAKAPVKKPAADRVKPSSASSAKMGRKKNVDGWEVYPVRIGSDEYGITNDGNGWYPYEGEHDYIGNDYFDSPKEALEALENYHGDKKAKGNKKPSKADALKKVEASLTSAQKAKLALLKPADRTLVLRAMVGGESFAGALKKAQYGGPNKVKSAWDEYVETKGL